MLEPSTPDDEAGRFLSVYDVFGGSAPESATEPVSANTTATAAATDTATAASSPTAEPLANTAAVDNNTSASTASTPAANPVTPLSETPGTPGTTDHTSSAAADAPGTDAASDSGTSHRGPARWIVTGVIAGLAFGFVQGNVNLVPGTKATVVAASPQMLTAAGAKTSSIPSATASTPVVTAEVSAMINDALANARRYHDRTGTFTGWRPAAPMLGATGGPYVVIVVDVDGVCYSTGIAPGYDNGIDIDQTGARCDVNTLNALQQKLDTIG